MWTWMHSWLLIFALFSIIPIVLHFMGRYRAPVLKFSAFDFLLAAHLHVPFWRKLLKYLLLVSRVLLMGLLVMAAARPFLKHFSKVDEDLINRPQVETTHTADQIQKIGRAHV